MPGTFAEGRSRPAQPLTPTRREDKVPYLQDDYP